jgi:hypothetical protein
MFTKPQPMNRMAEARAKQGSSDRGIGRVEVLVALVRDSEWIRLLREERFDEFNRKAAATPPNLENADLSRVDIRRANLGHANLRGAYLRDADLRGLDLTGADLHGASIHSARIAGVLFPASISTAELDLSNRTGTRMRAG